MLPAFFGLSAAALTERETDFFREVDPAGYILFARNCISPEQLRALTSQLRDLHGRDRLPILIDQEGGRVARLGPPHWPVFPNAQSLGALYQTAPSSAMEAARLNAQLIGRQLSALGINVDCLPVADVRDPTGHDIIGDRAYGTDPLVVAALGRSTLLGLQDAGVAGVIKHIPGHGRAAADSHVDLPKVTVDAEEMARDLLPFSRLNDAPMAMTAHVIYSCWDAERPATLSPHVISEVIRGQIGFDGLLMSDDLGMGALTGPFAVRARDALAAGCDIALHCSGDMAEMEEIAAALDDISVHARSRLDAAMAWAAAAPSGFMAAREDAELAERRDALLALA